MPTESLGNLEHKYNYIWFCNFLTKVTTRINLMHPCMQNLVWKNGYTYSYSVLVLDYQCQDLGNKSST